MKSRVLSIYFLLYIFTPFSPCVLASFLPSIFPCVSSPFSFFSIIYSYPFLFSFSVLTFHVAFLLPFFFLLFFSLRYPLSFYYFIYISTFLSFPFYCHARFPRLFGINCSGICFVFVYLSFLYLYLSSFQFLYILYFSTFISSPSLFSHSLFLLSPLLLNPFLLYILSTFLFCSSLLPHPFCSFIYSFHFLYIFFPFSLFVPLYILSIFSLLLLSILTLTSHVVLTAQRPLSWSLLPSVPRCCWGPGGVVGSQGQLAQKWPLASSGAWGTRCFVGRVRSQRSQGLPRVCLAGLEASLWAAVGSFVFVLLILCA